MTGGNRNNRRLVEAVTGGDETPVYSGRARLLGLPFSAEVDLGRFGSNLPDPKAVIAGRIAQSRGGKRLAYIAPTTESLPQIARWLAAYPDAAERLCVSTPTAIRTALMDAGRATFLRNAVHRLKGIRPDLSASQVATGAQMVAGLSVIALAALALWTQLPTALVALNFAGGVFFFGMTLLRFIAARQIIAGRRRLPMAAPDDDRDLPIYTVLAPLYREGALVGDLVRVLEQIDWPSDKLDIKILVEEDDLETRAFAARAVRGPPFEIVVIPPAEPRTKPKALAYALPFARGAFVTIYDAEDRPHPRQLREAHAVFSAAEPTLACLQAPIVIDNGTASPIARLFAIEYSALFDGLLPALADMRLPIPLGGTSNHFRREALERVGGWDPYNVTEDADLGIRLARFGYRSATINLPTYEEAPTALLPWLRQRTRWFKGWIQTWLVHTRHPVRLLRELGLRQFIGFSLVGVGMIVSAIIHPFYLATLLVVATNPLQLWGDGGVAAATAVGMNLFNLFAGYLAMATLAGRTLALRNRSDEAFALIGLPVYWLLMSVAGYRAIFQLVTRPFHWEKTPHKRRPPPRAAPRPGWRAHPLNVRPD